jgi:hypothetical protein
MVLTWKVRWPQGSIFSMGMSSSSNRKGTAAGAGIVISSYS